MPRGHKALRIDGRSPLDDDYPWQETWSLQAAPGYEEAANELLPWLQAASANSLVHLIAVGDIMLDRSLGDTLQRGDLAYPFAAVSEKLQEADITLGNVESALGDIGQPEAKRYPFRAPPEAAESLAVAGFDIVSLANNHAMDFGPASLLQAITLLQEQGVEPIGAGANTQEAHEPAIIEINGLKLAFLAYVHVPVEASTGFDTASWTATSNDPGLAWANPEEIKEDVNAIRDSVDLVTVVLHSGFEYVAAPSEPQTTAARAAVDAGADLVIGHHAHILQGIEYYGDGVIVYGTGNFAFEIDGPPETALFDIWLDKDGVRQIEIRPVIIQFGGQPRLAESWEAPAIRNRVYYLTNLLNPR
jgi:poly-gamma-glutamate synthesis protein (capsule biosynthesis protein)